MARSDRWSTPVERLMLAQAPLDAIAWAVACNPAIFAAVKAALDQETNETSPAIATITDNDLEFEVCQQVSCIAP